MTKERMSIELQHLMPWLEKKARALMFNSPVGTAEDLVQDTILKALTGAYNENAGNFKAWLHTIMNNTAVNYWRFRIKRTEREQHWLSEQFDPSSDDYSRLYCAIDHLTPIQRKIVLMRLKEWDYEKIGRKINREEGYARVQFYYAKQKLGKLLRQWEF